MRKIIILIIIIGALVGIYYLFKPTKGGKVYLKDSQESPIAPMTEQEMTSMDPVKELKNDGVSY